jgi:hypothetical protein
MEAQMDSLSANFWVFWQKKKKTQWCHVCIFILYSGNGKNELISGQILFR